MMTLKGTLLRFTTCSLPLVNFNMNTHVGTKHNEKHAQHGIDTDNPQAHGAQGQLGYQV